MGGDGTLGRDKWILAPGGRGGEEIGIGQTIYGEGKVVAIAPNVLTFEHYAIEIDRKSWGAIVTVELQVIDGKQRCVAWTLRARPGTPITSTTANRIPFAEAVDIAVREMSMSGSIGPDGRVDSRDLWPRLLGLGVATPVAQQGAVRVARLGRPPIPDEVVAKVLEWNEEFQGEPKRAERIVRRVKEIYPKGISERKVYDIVRQSKGKRGRG